MGKLRRTVEHWEKVRIGPQGRDAQGRFLKCVYLRFKPRKDRSGAIVIEFDAPREIEIEVLSARQANLDKPG